MTMELNRRSLLTGLAASLIVPAREVLAQVDDSLKQRAARRGMLYGCAVLDSILRTMPDLSAAVVREAGVVVPEFEMKWGVTQSRRIAPDYTMADSIANFAAENRLGLRGSTAVWYLNLPPWVPDELAKPGGRDLLLDHVREVVGRYRGKVVEWDVVNEAIEPRDGLPSKLRKSIFYKALGEDYIAESFRAAHDADPGAMLFYNDFALEYLTDLEQQWREGTLGLLSRLKGKGVPIHGLGIQAHLNVGNRFDENVFRRFLAEVAALGLRISITEFDVNDVRLAPDVKQRDAAVADHARRFLETAFDEKAVRTLITWGISDRVSWLNRDRQRPDKINHRSLPLDENMQRKPLWTAIAECFDGASIRD
jgi:endo-1,4-beta-xylanase